MDGSFLSELERRVLVADGGIETALQAYDLSRDEFEQHRGCNEILNDTRPDIVRSVHRGFLEDGSAAIESNTGVSMQW